MDDLIYLRDVNYKDWGQIYWPKGDEGAFTGPLRDCLLYTSQSQRDRG